MIRSLQPRSRSLLVLTQQTPVFMRTYFSYDPAQDQNSPCPEAGLKFERGSILQVVNREDPEWWQAVRDGDCRHRAGIIPSKTRRERLVCSYQLAS